jgi:lipopolysaccharide transport system ATP-binding protein
MGKYAIEVENISKQYRLGQVGTSTLRHDFQRLWSRMQGKEDPFLHVGDVNNRSVKASSDWVWALKDINFKVEDGEVLGIIGRNGAGKSTLLKILSMITAPTKGELVMNGRVASLLEVGTGFHQDLSGRDNIYMNGAVLGMRKKEIDAKLDAIVDFSGVEGYIDTPVKRYSSGMKMRLGFAVAAFLEPDILIVDEVLAVGDAEFQKKCLGKIKNVSSAEGRTVLFVSHNLGAVKNLTTRCIMLEHGELVSEGAPGKVIEDYLRMTTMPENVLLEGKRVNEFWGKDLRLNAIRPVFGGGLSFFHFGEPLQFEVSFAVQKVVVENLRFGCTISTLDERPVASMMTVPVQTGASEGEYKYKLMIRDFDLFPGSYRLSISLGTGDFQETRKEYDVLRDALIFHVENLSDTGNSVYNWRQEYGNLMHKGMLAEVMQVNKKPDEQI